MKERLLASSSHLLVASLGVSPHGSDDVRADSRQMSDSGSSSPGESGTSRQGKSETSRPVFYEKYIFYFLFYLFFAEWREFFFPTPEEESFQSGTFICLCASGVEGQKHLVDKLGFWIS